MDPKPKNHMERSTKAIPLYRIVILCFSQPRNVRRLPGPPVYASFWGDGKPPWLGAPKHTALMRQDTNLADRGMVVPVHIT